MRESELLAHIYARSRDLPEPIRIGPGDDAALLSFSGEGSSDRGTEVLVTVDQLIEGRHYDPSTATLDEVARKGVARSISDIAAMGGSPRCGLATGALRDGFAKPDALFEAMARWAMHWGAPLTGGDIAYLDGPTVLTVTVIGAPHATRGAVRRAGARLGDGLYVTGAIGGSLESGRHLSFEPRVEEAAWLCDTLGENLRAMIDLSDGLGRDADRLAEASGVGLEIEALAIPLAEGVDAWRDAIGDGEDYELLFAAAGDVPRVCEATGAAITRIGRVVESVGCTAISPEGERIAIDDLGWDHAG